MSFVPPVVIRLLAEFCTDVGSVARMMCVCRAWQDALSHDYHSPHASASFMYGTQTAALLTSPLRNFVASFQVRHLLDQSMSALIAARIPRLRHLTLHQTQRNISMFSDALETICFNNYGHVDMDAIARLPRLRTITFVSCRQTLSHELDVLVQSSLSLRLIHVNTFWPVSQKMHLCPMTLETIKNRDLECSTKVFVRDASDSDILRAIAQAHTLTIDTPFFTFAPLDGTLHTMILTECVLGEKCISRTVDAIRMLPRLRKVKLLCASDLTSSLEAKHISRMLEPLSNLKILHVHGTFMPRDLSYLQHTPTSLTSLTLVGAADIMPRLADEDMMLDDPAADDNEEISRRLLSGELLDEAQFQWIEWMDKNRTLSELVLDRVWKRVFLYRNMSAELFKVARF
jgi:hypothetical protein